MMTFPRIAFRAALFWLAVASAHADFGGRFLDGSFGVNGQATITTPGNFRGSLRVGRNGDLLVLYSTSFVPNGGPGVVRLARLRPNGAIDTTFGASGHVDIATFPGPGDGEFRPAEVHEDARGRIWVAGYLPGRSSAAQRSDLMVTRYTARGALDTSFGSAGRSLWTPPPFSRDAKCNGDPRVQGITERPDGTVVVYGTRLHVGEFMMLEYACMFVARYTAEGLDAQFGHGGVAENQALTRATLLSGHLHRDGTFEALGWNGRYLRWVVGRGGETVMETAAPGDALAGPLFADPDGIFVRVLQPPYSAFSDRNPVTLEFYDREGRRAAALGAQGRVQALSSGERYELAGLTPDGGAFAKGIDADPARAPQVHYRHHLCVWRSGGRLEGCETIGTPDLHYGNATNHVAADGTLYVVSESPVISPDLPRHGIIARFNMTAPLVEYHNDILGHYFTTYDGSEAQAIDRGAAGPGWRRTAHAFESGGTNPVCRFYGTPGIGPNSHFYTIEPEECEQVKRDPGWTFEGLGFYATRVVNGGCEAPLMPVHRLYNNRAARNDSNHRYVTDTSLIGQMTASGWIHEGVVFCVRP